MLLVLLVPLVSLALVDHLDLRGQLGHSDPKEHLYVLNKKTLILHAGTENNAHLLFYVFLDLLFVVQGDPGIAGFKGEAGPKGEIVSSDLHVLVFPVFNPSLILGLFWSGLRLKLSPVPSPGSQIQIR